MQNIPHTYNEWNAYTLLVTLPVALIRDSDESNSREKSLFRLIVSRDHFPTVRKTWLQVGKAMQQEQ